MLFHASLPTQNPERAAAVLAELWRGRAFPFPPLPGSFIVFADDEHGTCLELYPAGQVLVPGPQEAEATARPQAESAGTTETHVAIGVPLDEAEIHRIAAREGWMSRTCSRGDVFHVVEVWVENRLMIEALTPRMQAEYLAGMSAENWAAYFGFDGAQKARTAAAPEAFTQTSAIAE
jgi:hypothetical protein